MPKASCILRRSLIFWQSLSLTFDVFSRSLVVLAPPKDAALPYDLRTKLPSFGTQYTPPAANWLNSSNDSSTDDHQPVKPSPARRNASRSDSIQGGGVDVESNERALLGRFLTRLHKLDPDLIIGHDLWGHQVELLVQRLQANKIPHWHRIGRLRRSAQYPISATSRVSVMHTWLSL